MFSNVPPKISVPLLYAILVGSLLYRFFFANLYGMLFLSLVLYSFSYELLGVEAYTFTQLVGWFSAQSEGAKTALLSSIVTVIGFLIAYASATYNWKAQALSQLRMQASNDIETFFAQSAALATDCKIYAEFLRRSVEKIKNNCTDDEAVFLANYGREQAQKFLQQRQQLVALGIEVHRLQARYSGLLTRYPSLKSNMDYATQSLNNIADKVWFNVPFYIEGDESPVASFVSQVNLSDCEVFIKTVSDSFVLLNSCSGAIRGYLQSNVIGFSVWSLVAMFKDRTLMSSAIREHYNAIKNRTK